MPSVGIGGHALGGGYGLASRAWGLASDNVLAVQIVTADGKVIVADPTHHPDLYWACRGGGGGNFGLVTRFTFRTHAVAQGSYFVATWPWAQATDVIASFLAWAPHQPDALGALCRLAAGPGGPTVQVFGQFLGSETALKSALASLRPPASKLTTGTAPWLDLVRRWAGCLGHPLPDCAAPGHTVVRRCLGLPRQSPASAVTSRGSRRCVEARGASSGALLIDAYGGAINRVKPAATAFVHRNVLALDPVLRRRSRRPRLGRRLARCAQAGGDAARRTSTTSTPHLANWQQAYYGANLPRLRAVKKKVDPHNLFRFPQSIRA